MEDARWTNYLDTAEIRKRVVVQQWNCFWLERMWQHKGKAEEKARSVSMCWKEGPGCQA